MVALLREVRYLKQRDTAPPDQTIPDSALAVYASEDIYRKFLQNLDVIVSLYNKVTHIIYMYLPTEWVDDLVNVETFKMDCACRIIEMKGIGNRC